MAPRTLIRLALAAVLYLGACSLSACSQRDEIAVDVYPATLARTADPLPASGERVEFGGSQRGGAGLYDIGAEPLLTAWSLVAIRAASQPDGSWAVVARLSAYGKKQMAAYSADETGGRKFLAVKIDGRWTDFGPLLAEVRDRVTLYGFTKEETERLERSIANR